MGRPRKPTAIKRQQGTLQPCRTNPHEPQLDPSLPPPPEGLPPRVIEEYYAIGSRLLDMRVMTAADVGALVACARAYVDWIEACEEIDRNGSQFVDAAGGIRAHPAISIRNEADRRHRAWLQSLGLTPSDRSKVNAQKSEAKSDLARLLESADAGDGKSVN